MPPDDGRGDRRSRAYGTSSTWKKPVSERPGGAGRFAAPSERIGVASSIPKAVPAAGFGLWDTGNVQSHIGPLLDALSAA